MIPFPSSSRSLALLTLPPPPRLHPCLPCPPPCLPNPIPPLSRPKQTCLALEASILLIIRILQTPWSSALKLHRSFLPTLFLHLPFHFLLMPHFPNRPFLLFLCMF